MILLYVVSFCKKSLAMEVTGEGDREVLSAVSLLFKAAVPAINKRLGMVTYFEPYKWRIVFLR